MNDRRLFAPEPQSGGGAVHNIEQGAILVLSAVAIAMVNLGPDDQWRFWGNVVGLCGSPFWLHANWATQPRQWGQFALSVAYAGIWLVGIVRYY